MNKRRTGRGRPVSSEGGAGDGPTPGRDTRQQMKAKPYRHLVHARPLLVQPIVFLSCSTHERRGILDSHAVHDVLYNIWSQSQERNGWVVGKHVVMPDHVHLFARAGTTATSMARWIGMWKSVSARSIAGLLCIRPPIWQEDYFDRFLRTSESYADKWQYVQLNPVRAGLVSDPAAWPYQGTIQILESVTS